MSPSNSFYLIIILVNKIIILVCTHSSKMNSNSFTKRMGVSLKDEKISSLIEDLIKKITFDNNCLTVISDRYYYDVFTAKMFDRIQTVPIFKILVKENEDLFSPNYVTVSVILQARRKGCDGYIILIANADQTIRLLRFGDRHRVIDTRAKFILFYDSRLFQKNSLNLWKKIVNVIFIHKFHDINRYDFMTVPFPSPMVDNWKPIAFESWKSGKFQKNKELFPDKTSNLKGKTIHVATFEYMPSTLKNLEDNQQGNDPKQIEYSGLEIQIMKSLSDAMNFHMVIYEPINSNIEAWGRQQLNGSYTGLLGELTSGKADFALGNFLHTPNNLKLLDLSIPYITQCFTFLTPESTTDNSWKTLILPFKKFMWLGVVLTLVACTLVFNGLAKFYTYQYKEEIINLSGKVKYSFWKDLLKLWQDKKKVSPKNGLNQIDNEETSGLYLFTGIQNSLFNAYSMLLLVSLPKMPTGWSLRMFTGCWWLYCILVTVAYRSSMTAILANPPQRVTINTLDELALSPISCGGWGEQNKEFFTTSLDSAGQRVGRKFEVVYDSDAAINRVAQGDFAFYENIYYLNYAKVKQNVKKLDNGTEGNNTHNTEKPKDLHIMGDCVINMPISLGMQKNSPLKLRVDKFLQRVIEAGLVKKWLADVMLNALVAESPIEKSEMNAVMNFKKFSGALVALAIGYTVGIIVLVTENIYWYYIEKRNPLFDKYKLSCYFSRK